MLSTVCCSAASQRQLAASIPEQGVAASVEAQCALCLALRVLLRSEPARTCRPAAGGRGWQAAAGAPIAGPTRVNDLHRRGVQCQREPQATGCSG